MSNKMNPPSVGSSRMNHEEKLAGGTGLASAVQSNYALLRRVTLANLLWEDNAYVDGVSVAQEIARLIPLCDPQSVADLAVELRTKQKLRHTPLFMIVEMLKYPATKVHVSRIIPLICTRADMMTDLVSLYWGLTKGSKMGKVKRKPLASQLKKGLTKAFANFDEYQFAKYDRNGGVKLRDVMFLTRPTPAQDRVELYKRIADRTLNTPDTWEVALSSGKDKLGTWNRLIESNKLGGLAFLRNIRNMMDAKVPKKTIDAGLGKLNTRMLLPLDFLKSARINSEFKDQIEEAMIRGYSTMPKLPGRTLFIIDVSGSMGSMTSSGSEFSRLDQAAAMAMLAMNQSEDCELVCTAGREVLQGHKTELIRYPKKGFGVFEQVNALRNTLGGGGIFTRQCLEWCKANIDGEFDRIIIFSDSQDMDNVNRVPKPFAKHNYICDVSSHKKGINYKGVWTAEISGWSEHFLTYIAASEGLENVFDSQD